MSRTPLRVAWSAVVLTVISALLASAPSNGLTAPDTRRASVLSNGDFSQGKTGWRATTSGTVLAITSLGRTGSSAELRSYDGIAAMSTTRRVEVTRAGSRIDASAWVRTSTPGVTVTLKVFERFTDQEPIRHTRQLRLGATGWTRIHLDFVTQRKSRSLRLAVRGAGLGEPTRVRVDDVSLSGNLRAGSDTCRTNERGVPTCNAYAGGAYNSNSDPAPWESWLTGNLGVRRTYFSPTQIDSAAHIAAGDVADGRIPWVSFKTPYSWSAMASGAGDDWAARVGAKLARVDGPVWVAIHHEPENDGGNIEDWTRMQQRLAPIIRGAGPNIAYTIILMGYHQFYGESQYHLANLWPTNVKIDVAGFDIYDEYGMVKDGEVIREHKQFRKSYFNRIQRWALREGVDWGIAETGFTQASILDRPDIMRKTFADLVDTGGVAWAYFNTPLNSTADWTLNTPAKKTAFAQVHEEAIQGG